MKKIALTLCLVCIGALSHAQYYFPPKLGSAWDTMNPSQLGWCQDSINSLYTLLDQGKSKGFIVLKDGKIVLEKYFNGHTKDSFWYWASAGKTMTAFLVGRAQEQNLLKITDSTYQYLGNGWTSMTAEREKAITIRHQLTMTTGLNPILFDCTTPGCLKYWQAPGTRWFYHNSPYTLLKEVVEDATGKTYNNYLQTEVTLKTGIVGLWVKSGFNNLLLSNTRSMARFGSLILNKGVWDGTPVITDTNYLNDCIRPSQSINKSYGYLWWLNGKESHILPGSAQVIQGMIAPNAPADMYAGIGKNGQYVCVVPSQNMIVVRMGDSPDSSLVPNEFINKIFTKLGSMSCGSLRPTPSYIEREDLSFYPNPILKKDRGTAHIYSIKDRHIEIYATNGERVSHIELKDGDNEINLSYLASGLYMVKSESKIFKIQVE